MFFDVQTILMQYKRKFTDYFLCKMQLNTIKNVYLRACQAAMTTKVSVITRVDKLKGYCNIGYQEVVVIFYYKRVNFSCNGKWKTVSNHLKEEIRKKIHMVSEKYGIELRLFSVPGGTRIHHTL